MPGDAHDEETREDSMELQPGDSTLFPVGAEAARLLTRWDEDRVVVRLRDREAWANDVWTATVDERSGLDVLVRRADCGLGCRCAGEVRVDHRSVRRTSVRRRHRSASPALAVLGRVLAVVGLVLIPAAVLVAPAHADPFSLCKDAPPPVSPKTGLPGLLTPAPANIPASAPDPFADPKVPIGDVYGYDWHWTNYDLGCGNDFLRDPTAVTNTQTANILLSIADGTLASLAALEQLAKAMPLDWLATPLQKISAALKDDVLTLWFPLTTAALAVLVLWRANKASYHETAKVTAVFVAAVALAVFALVYPATLSKQVDRAVLVVADVTGSAFATSATDAVNRESAYRTWLAGSFGDPDGPAAKQYGPRLMSATHYSWSDWQRIQDDPGTQASIDKAKAAKFKSIAAALEVENPTAYETFTGRGERTGPALFGVVSVAAVGLFVGIAALMVLLARVLMQSLTLVAPLAAVAGILPKWHGILATLWDLFTAGLITVAKFTLAGGIMAGVLGAVQGADLSGAGRLFFVVVATAVGLVLTKPLRSFKTLVPGLDPNQSYLKRLVQHVGPALAGGAGSYAGVVNGFEAAAATPAGTPAESSQRQWVGDVRATDTTSLAALPLPAHAASSTPELALTEGPVVEGPVLGGVPMPLALPGPRPELVTAAAADDDPVPRHHTITPSRAATDLGERTAAALKPQAVVRDPSLYHPGPAQVEEHVPARELELDEDGFEHEQVIYHSPRS